MPFYQRLGDIPRKRHIQFRENGTLLTEEVMGLEGFTGNESILYHLQSPCRVMKLDGFQPIERKEWVPDQHAHRHFATFDIKPEGDEISGRRLLMWNNDVEISLCRPTATMDYFFRNGEGDEVVFVHEGSGVLETIFGDVPYKDGDYLVIPRGTTYRFQPAPRLPEAASASSLSPQRYLVFETPGLIEIPRRYRNHYGQIMEGAPYYHRDIHPPTELHTVREKGEFPVRVRVRDGYQTYVVDYHPFDVVGWDGYLYPWTFSIHDFEPITGRIHQPPPSHQTFAGQNFVICSFCPRKLDFDPLAVPIPYHHSNLQSEEMIYYVSGNFGSRKGVEVGSITLHPSGLPHGPQPGLAEKAIGLHETHELAVMCDTFNPLKLTKFAKELDDGVYWRSWYDNAGSGAGTSVDGDASGAGLTSHF
jgi:homogentisate 1,2-dioxygenase